MNTPQCDKCGTEMFATGGILGPVGTLSAHFKCGKCGNRLDVPFDNELIEKIESRGIVYVGENS